VSSSCFFFFQAEDGIRDFHVTGVQTCALPISAFRTVMVVGVKPSSLRETLNKKVNSIIAEQHKPMVNTIKLYNGRLVKQNTDHFLISFESVTNAVLCTLQIQAEFERNSGSEMFSLIKLNIGVSAGVPVDEEAGFFENSIKAAYSYFDLVKGTVVLSSQVNDLYDSENLSTPSTTASV